MGSKSGSVSAALTQSQDFSPYLKGRGRSFPMGISPRDWSGLFFPGVREGQFMLAEVGNPLWISWCQWEELVVFLKHQSLREKKD